MGASGNTQVIIRPGNIQLLKENIGHVVVIMLPGMNQNLMRLAAQQPGNNGGLNELGARPYDG